MPFGVALNAGQWIANPARAVEDSTASAITSNVYIAGQVIWRYTTSATSNVVNYAGCAVRSLLVVTMNQQYQEWPGRVWITDDVAVPAEPYLPANLAESQAKIQCANDRALTLVREVLNEVENEELRTHQRITVTGKSGRRYQLTVGRSGNVKEINPQTGEAVAVLCYHPRPNIPDYDTLLAQKLHLENDDEHFRAEANLHWVAPNYQRLTPGRAA